MEFLIDGQPTDLPVRSLTVAGWTGRSKAKVQAHIVELQELGIAPPSSTPLFYRVAQDMLTQAAHIEVLGSDTSGEVEPILTSINGKLAIGLSSDHTDRKLEAYSIPHSKQICAKPVAQALWWFDDLENSDELQLECDILEDGEWVSYQTGTAAMILDLRNLWERSGLGDGDWMLCGTFPVVSGGIRPASTYRMSMTSPHTATPISLAYAVSELPEIS